MKSKAMELFITWDQAKAKVSSTFGRISVNVIRPGDSLYSIQIKSFGAYGMRGDCIDLTKCSRCGRTGGRNEYDFGLLAQRIELAGDHCEECGVTASDLEELAILAQT